MGCESTTHAMANPTNRPSSLSAKVRVVLSLITRITIYLVYLYNDFTYVKKCMIFRSRKCFARCILVSKHDIWGLFCAVYLKKMASIRLIINAVLSDKIGSLISMNPSLNKFSSRPKAFIRKDIRINRLPNKGKIIYLFCKASPPYIIITFHFIPVCGIMPLVPV